MSSKYMLEQLHRHTANGYQVTVAESLRNDTIRLTYQTRPGGRIVGWYVEGPGMSFPLKFKTEQEARELIRKMDKTRPNYYNFYSDKEWGVASSYHLSVDSGVLGVHKTVDFIQKFVEEALKD